MRVAIKGSLKSHRVFFRYLISYCLVLLVPLTFGTFAFLRTSRDFERQVMQDTAVLIENRISLLDQRLQELDDFAAQLTLDDRIRAFLSFSSPLEDGASVWAVYELQDVLSPYKLSSRFIETFHLSFATSKTVITPYYSFVEMRFFYDHFFRHGERTASEWFESLFNSYHQKTILPSVVIDFGTKKLRALTYIQSLPLNRTAINRGALAVFIPENEFLRHLRGAHGQDDQIVVRDAGGHILISTLGPDSVDITEALSRPMERNPLEFEIDGNSNVVFKAISELNGWQYFVLTTRQSVGAKLHTTRRTLWIILAVAIAIGLIVAYLMAYRRSRPILRLFDLLRGDTPRTPNDQGELEYIKGSVEQLIQRDNELRHTLDAQRPLLQATFLERLLKGMFDSNDEIEAYRRGMGLPPLLGMSNVIIFRWSRAERPVEGSHQELLQVRTALVRKILQQQFGTGMYFYDIDFDRIASIVTFTPESWSESEFREKVGEGVRLIRRAVSVGTGEERLIVGVGTLTSNNTGISGSAERALAAADYMPLTETQPIVWYSEMPTEGSAYYPLELATELINSVRSGDSPDIARLVDLVFQKNFVGSRLPLREQQQLKFDLRDTVQKLAEQFPAGDDEMTGRLHHGMSRFDESATVEDMFRDLRSVLALIAESADLRKKSHNVKLRDAVVRHVHTNFTDADLYLATVAAEFGITKEYLSQFFKEQTGVKFSTYIERLRIGKASELMGNNALTVSQVAIACGYRSPQVFRRAFKRITGATPKELRLTG